jgi:small-conductance mechanosensitive channel
VALALWQEIVGSALIVAFFALLGEGASRLLRRFGKRAGLKETTLGTIRDAARVIWVILAVLGVALYTNLTSELTVLAVSTVGGLIVSLALQATLSNVIAGLFMLQDGTLRVGDQVAFSSIKGKVVRVSLRTSWIMTDAGTIAVVSNANLMSGPLINQTATSRLVAKHHLYGEIPVHPAGESAPARPEESPTLGDPGGVSTIPVKRLRRRADPAGDSSET